MQTSLNVPFPRLKYFLTLLLKLKDKSWFAESSCFQFSVRHTPPPQQSLDSLIFKHFRPLSSTSVFGWSHVFEAKARSAFKLICLYHFLSFNVCLLCGTSTRDHLRVHFACSKHCVERNFSRRSHATPQGSDLQPGCAGAECHPSTSWTPAKVLGASEPAKPPSLGPTARERLWFLEDDVQQDKWRIPWAAEGDISLEIIWWNW